MNNHKPITERTEEFAIRIIKAYGYLDEKPGATRVLGKQLLRSGTSIGANVHEAQSAQSNRDFINKLEIALKEARETIQFTVRNSQFAITDSTANCELSIAN